jgi:hypothetical protein
MPYAGERANKASHQSIVDNPTVAAFLQQCNYLKEPSEREAAAMTSAFALPPETAAATVPDRVVAIDGSPHEGSVDEKLLPSTRIGYVQIGAVLIDLKRFSELWVRDGRFVDPFAVARLDEANDRLIFTVPSSNTTYRGNRSVRASFRAAVDEHFASEATWTRPGDPTSSLRTTLFMLAARRTGPLGTGDPSQLLLNRCPNGPCTAERVPVTTAPEAQCCPACGGLIYATDCLRIWEDVTDFQANKEALGRLMNAVEQLLLVHYVRTLVEQEAFATLAATAFFVDGQLAIHGNMAWLHGPILDYLLEVNGRLAALGHPELVILGLQKTGQIADYVRLVDHHIANNRLLVIDDEFRYRYIAPRPEASVTFGLETHYGQDFIYKTPSGRCFVFALPYPLRKDPRDQFADLKCELSLYRQLSRALRLLVHLESDLYENASIPIVLAHRYTAISLVPGGKVLDLLSRQALG